MNLMGILGGLGLFMVGAFYLMVAKQGALGLIGRNGSIGIRTRKTQVSDVAWDAAHRAAAPLVRTVGIAAVIFGAALVLSGFLWQQENPPAVTMIIFALGYGAVLVGSVPVAIRANAAAVRAHATQDQSNLFRHR
ncbi:SdpI family protein [Kocuria sp. cx-455]|uniref:SdpI family protein n=1 Tax=Kocuria sp. cx-455 TaxID=2771377 RepID=UPI0016872FDF|nr:SdpI family protein [Kocuria sp. cx-455]MBD2765842.1 SdpI family protein [Kocuria sp. cx-455]